MLHVKKEARYLELIPGSQVPIRNRAAGAAIIRRYMIDAANVYYERVLGKDL